MTSSCPCCLMPFVALDNQKPDFYLLSLSFQLCGRFCIGRSCMDHGVSDFAHDTDCYDTPSTGFTALRNEIHEGEIVSVEGDHILRKKLLGDAE